LDGRRLWLGGGGGGGGGDGVSWPGGMWPNGRYANPAKMVRTTSSVFGEFARAPRG